MIVIHRRVLQIALIANLFVILLFSIIPGPQIPIDHSDKINHVAAYLALSTLVQLSFTTKKTRLIWIVLALLLAVGTELIQVRLPGRVPSLYDLLANLSGIALGIPFSKLLRKVISVR